MDILMTTVIPQSPTITQVLIRAGAVMSQRVAQQPLQQNVQQNPQQMKDVGMLKVQNLKVFEVATKTLLDISFGDFEDPKPTIFNNSPSIVKPIFNAIQTITSRVSNLIEINFLDEVIQCQNGKVPIHRMSYVLCPALKQNGLLDYSAVG